MVVENNKMPSHHGVLESHDDDYPNKTLKLLIERASCRNFSDKKIDQQTLHYLFEAGVHAPSGGNLQPFSIIKIEDDNTKKKLAKMCWQEFMAKAPLNLIFCIDWRRIERWAQLEIAPFSATSSFEHFWISFQDTIICAQNICTAADSLGLGSVYIGTIFYFLPELRDMLNLPKGVIPVVLLCIGYPKSELKIRKKLSVDTVVHNEKYQETSDKDLRDAFNAKYPNVRIEITEERLKRIYEVCRTVHGEEFAKKCISKIKENGYINPVQRYFGLHYYADKAASRNDEFLKIMEEFGFGWFKKYKPYKEQAT